MRDSGSGSLCIVLRTGHLGTSVPCAQRRWQPHGAACSEYSKHAGVGGWVGGWGWAHRGGSARRRQADAGGSSPPRGAELLRLLATQAAAWVRRMMSTAVAAPRIEQPTQKAAFSSCCRHGSVSAGRRAGGMGRVRIRGGKPHGRAAAEQGLCAHVASQPRLSGTYLLPMQPGRP